MKYAFILSLSLSLVSCSDRSPDPIINLKKELKFTTKQLESCQSSLSMYRNASSTDDNRSFSEPEEPSAPAEPEYETVYAYHIDVSGSRATTCYTRNEGADDTPACGVTFTDCKDGSIYRCMQNIKYKVTEEQKEIKEE